MARLLRLPEVMTRVGLRRTQIYDGMRKGLFPLSVPVLEGRSIVAWVEDEIDAYVESRRRARDHKLKEEAAKAKAAPDDPRKTALAAGCKETAEIG